MTRVIAILAVVFVLCDIGLAGSLYVKRHPHSVSETRVAVVASNVRREVITDQEHKTLAERAESSKRKADAIRIIARSRDLFLTGDPDGTAEWHSANEETAICGVTSEGRYLLFKNELGTTRFDEHLEQSSTARFASAWNRADCQTTAPVNQAKLLANAAEERLYQQTHPLDGDCLMREMRELANGDSVVARRQLAHPHECNRTPAELEASMRASAEQKRETALQNDGGP